MLGRRSEKRSQEHKRRDKRGLVSNHFSYKELAGSCFGDVINASVQGTQGLLRPWFHVWWPTVCLLEAFEYLQGKLKYSC